MNRAENRPRTVTLLLAVAAVVFFCAPLFVGLGGDDLHGDEPIYSFAVDAMLETNDWLTPRAIPDEKVPFLEKPPLKFWLVAGAIRAGLLPRDEFGYRFWDAAFGALAFLYVFAIGCRLAGPACGFVAVLILFVHDPLVFGHGLRSNNMEASLFLGYCGAVYHMLAWASADRMPARWLHPLGVGAFFVLGFMTKFVAAAFLPVMLTLMTMIFAHWRHRLRADWRPWMASLLLVLVATVPWFAYQTAARGRWFWSVLVGDHVYKRMTAFVDPAHLEPWHYYFTTLFGEFVSSGTAVVVFAGTAWLAIETARKRWDEGALILLWFAFPVIAISFGTSKLYHYVYPFLPPLALGAGYLAAGLLARASPVRRALEYAGGWLGSIRWVRLVQLRSPRLRRTAVVLGCVAIAVAFVTIFYGRFGIRIGGEFVFRNTSIVRPLVIGLVLLMVADAARLAGQLALVLLLSTVFVRSAAYRDVVERLNDKDEPLQVLRACILAEVPDEAGRGVYVHNDDTGSWAYVYYFRDVGWDRPRERTPALLMRRLFVPGEQRAVLMTEADYLRVDRALADEGTASASRSGDPNSLTRLRQLAAVRFGDERLLLLPGPYANCASPAGWALRHR